MKTIEELYKAILADDELKAKYAEAVESGRIEEFLKAEGCDATVDDVKVFLESKKEVSLDELEATAGGCEGREIGWSIMTLGVGCAVSACMDENGHDYTDCTWISQCK